MTTISKQPSEIFPIGGSIYGVGGATEQIVLETSTVTAVDRDGTDVSASLLDQATIELGNDEDGGTNNVLLIKVQAGTANAGPYKVTFNIDTTETNHYEVDVLVVVKEE